MNSELKPKIRFKGFTDDWEQRKLGAECFELIAGGDIDKTRSVNNGKYPIYANALTNDGIVGYYNDSYRVKSPAVTITGRGEIGYAMARNTDFTPVVRLISLRSKHNNYFLANAINLLNVVSESTGVPQLTIPQVEKFDICFPKNINEEIKLGRLFNEIDNLITLHQRKCDKLVELKKSLLEKMFPQNNSVIPEIRFKGFTNDWEQRKLEDITQIVMGQSPDSINYTDNSDDTVLIQGNADLNNGIVVPRIWSSQITKKSYPNDIIFTVRAPVGEIARNPYYATIGRGVASFKGNDFLYQSLIQKKENNYWNNISAGSTFDSINSDQLKNVIIYLPKNNLEQEKIGELFTNLDNLITLHQCKYDKLNKIRQSLLNDMFI